MQKLALSVIIGTFSLISIAQQKEKVPSLAEGYHSITWYQTQQKLWKEEVKTHPKSENAWENYYRAVRTITLLENNSPLGTKSDPAMAVLDEMEIQIPNSYTFNFAKGNQLGSWNKESIIYTKRAYHLEPNNPRTYPNLVVYHEMHGELSERKAINEKWFYGNYYSSGLLNYHSNLLNSLDQNAIIFTGGDNDSYPIWLLQDVMKLRPDVTVINRFMAGSPIYLSTIFKRLGLKVSPSKINSFEFKFDISPEERDDYLVRLIKFIAKNCTRPVYTGLTLGTRSLEAIENELYLIGLANKYAPNGFDNLAVLKDNMMNNYRLDYLEQQYYIETKIDIVNLCNQNYIPCFLTLFDHYKTSNDLIGLDRCKHYLQLLAATSPRKQEILTTIR